MLSIFQHPTTGMHWQQYGHARQARMFMLKRVRPIQYGKEERWLKLQRNTGRIVQVGFQNRSGQYNYAAKDYIQSGKLGQVVHIRIYNLLPVSKWIPQPEEAVPQALDWDGWLGPAPFRTYNPALLKGWIYFYDYCPGFLDDAVHQFDLTRLVMGDPGHPQSVYGWGGKHIWNSDQQTPEVQSMTFDYDKFTMTCESGNVTGIYVKNTKRHPDGSVTIPRMENQCRQN